MSWKKHQTPRFQRRSRISFAVTYSNKTTEWGILFNQNPIKNHQAEVRRTKGFCLGRICEGVLVEQNTEWMWFLFLSRDFLNLYLHLFMGNYSCFHITTYLRSFTSNLLCLNVHLNFLSLDNHLVSKQQQWHCHVTKWGHVTKQILNLAGWGQLRRDQNEWFNHYLGLIRSWFINIYFLYPCDVIFCKNNLFM